MCLAKEEKSARKGLLKELEVLQHKYTLLEKEKDDVMAQLAVRTEGQQKLAYEVSILLEHMELVDHCFCQRLSKVMQLLLIL